MTSQPPLTDQENADFMAMFLKLQSRPFSRAFMNDAFRSEWEAVQQAQTLEEMLDLDRRLSREILRLWNVCALPTNYPYALDTDPKSVVE